MTRTTIEEASSCPTCKEPGASTRQARGPHGSIIHSYVCENTRCPAEGLGWIVQVNEDGSIPFDDSPADPRQKQFPQLSADQQAAAQRRLEQMFLPDKRIPGDQGDPESFRRARKLGGHDEDAT